MTAQDAPASVLSEQHADELAASGVGPAEAAARGYRTMYGSDADHHELKDLRVPRWAWRGDDAFPALLLPMYRVTGERISCQFKPAVPQRRHPDDASPQKYASPAGTLHLDVPPTVADLVRDDGEPLWITEGLKKADCLATLGKAVVTLTGVFNWRSRNGTLGDWEDVPLRGRTAVVCFDSDAAQNRNVMMAMRRLGKWLDSKGVREVHYLIVPPSVGDVPVKGVDDYLSAGGTMEGLRDAVLRELPVDGPQDAAFTDSVLADTLCSEELEGSYRWAQGLGWMRWDGRVWSPCSDVTVTETVRLWGLEQFSRALERQRSDMGRSAQASIDGWRSVLSGGRIRTLVGLAKGVLECAAEAFDANPDLLNCPNGVVDLRTGHLLPADPDLLMTKITGTDYVKDARHPDWDQALTALPADARAWFQARVGQAATGYTPPDDLAVVSQGGGSNGKSTVADALAAALGKYHMVVSDRAMLGNASENHPTEMMDFMGARFAVLEETPESRQLDVVRLKKLTGTAEIEARRIRQDSVTFTATHSLFVNTNYKPVVVETDHGTWRRLVLLRWPYSYRESAQECRGAWDRVGDPTLRQRVKGDPLALEAALAWVVEGARAWYAADQIMPTVPDRVRADTRAWRMESDPVLGFLTDTVVFEPGSHVLAAELFAAFRAWMEERRNKEWSVKTFIARFGGHDACAQNGVELKVMKHREGLSRLNGDSSHGATYRAWRGLRFARPDEVVEDAETADPENPESADLQGYSSYTSAVKPRIAGELGVTGQRVTAVTVTRVTDNRTVDQTGQDPFSGAPEDPPAPPAEALDDLPEDPWAAPPDTGVSATESNGYEGSTTVHDTHDDGFDWEA